jgi:tRNA(fMet)-specific endonuclease VapC
MVFVLDTNIIIGVINHRNPNIRKSFRETLASGEKMLIPVVVLFELRYGIAKSDRAAKALDELNIFLSFGTDILPFTPEDAVHAGKIRADLEIKGTPIGPYDVLIAAQARRIGAILVTENTKEFSRVSDLIVTNWAD